MFLNEECIHVNIRSCSRVATTLGYHFTMSTSIAHPPSRLVTGARNGAIKLWNYNNGQCIRSLDKGMHPTMCVVHSVVGGIKQEHWASYLGKIQLCIIEYVRRSVQGYKAHVMSCDVMWAHVISWRPCDVMWFHGDMWCLWCHVRSCDVCDVVWCHVMCLRYNITQFLFLSHASERNTYWCMRPQWWCCVCMSVGNSEEVTDMKFVSVNLNRLAVTSMHCRLNACV